MTERGFGESCRGLKSAIPLPKSPIRDWFQRRYAEPTPPQAVAWPRLQAGENVLIVSPTGTGKTFAAFLGVLNELALLHEQGALRDGIYAIYVSPLRALGSDLLTWSELD